MVLPVQFTQLKPRKPKVTVTQQCAERGSKILGVIGTVLLLGGHAPALWGLMKVGLLESGDPGVCAPHTHHVDPDTNLTAQPLTEFRHEIHWGRDIGPAGVRTLAIVSVLLCLLFAVFTMAKVPQGKLITARASAVTAFLSCVFMWVQVAVFPSRCYPAAVAAEAGAFLHVGAVLTLLATLVWIFNAHCVYITTVVPAADASDKDDAEAQRPATDSDKAPLAEKKSEADSEATAATTDSIPEEEEPASDTTPLAIESCKL